MNTEKTLNGLRNLMLLSIAGISVYGLIISDMRLFINSFLPLLIGLIPYYFELRYDYSLNVFAGLWIALAALLHSMGAVTFYARFEWYDQVAHAVSGAMIAGVGYSLVEALDRYSADVNFPPRFQFLFILLFTLGVGALWEILEFSLVQISELLGGEPVVAQYGVKNIVQDLIFNLIGGVFMGLFGTKIFEGLAGFLRDGSAGENLK